MKILVLSNLYPPHYVGGYELHCQTIVEALRSRGHTVEVLTSDHGVEGVTAVAEEPGIERALKIHGLFGHPFVGILQLKSIELHNNQTLVSTLQRVKPDLVYVWSFTGLSRSMLFTLQQTGIPTVYAICDHWLARSTNSDVWLNWWHRDNARFQHRVLRNIWTWTGHRDACSRMAPINTMSELRLRRIYFCSGALRDFTAAAGYDVKHGAVIYCPVDVEFFEGRPRTAAEPLKRLLYVGRLNDDKGIMTALRGMALAGSRFDGELTIHGHGELNYEKQLMQFVEDNKLRVTFKAFANPSKMPQIYAQHDALLFPSEWPEPFALAPLEAMACGLPVIGTTTGGSIELFRHKDNALTYKAGDAAELAERIVLLASDHAMRERIARAGQQEVRSRFAKDVIVNQIENYLDQTLREWPRSTPLQSAA